MKQNGIIVLIVMIACVLARPVMSAESDAVKTMMPEADFFAEKSIAGISYYEAHKDKALLGYCIKVTAQGYMGSIRAMVCIDTAGIIKSIDILKEGDTPGFGDRLTEVRPGETKPYFLEQFKGRRADKVEIGKGIDAITGATVSCRAVTDAVRNTVNSFMAEIKKKDIKQINR